MNTITIVIFNEFRSSQNQISKQKLDHCKFIPFHIKKDKFHLKGVVKSYSLKNEIRIHQFSYDK